MAYVHAVLTIFFTYIEFNAIHLKKVVDCPAFFFRNLIIHFKSKQQSMVRFSLMGNSFTAWRVVSLEEAGCKL